MASETNERPILSVVVPYLSRSRCIDLCRTLVRENTHHDFEIVEVVDNTDVYEAYNEGVARAKADIVALINDDMFVAPGWDVHLVAACGPKTLVTTYLVEPGNLPVNHRNIELDYGRTTAAFDRAAFESYVRREEGRHPEIMPGFGWYMPFAIRREEFSPFLPWRDGIPMDALWMGKLASVGYTFSRARSFAYHLQGTTSSGSLIH